MSITQQNTKTIIRIADETLRDSDLPTYTELIAIVKRARGDLQKWQAAHGRSTPTQETLDGIEQLLSLHEVAHA